MAFWTQLIPHINARLKQAEDLIQQENNGRWHRIWVVTMVTGCPILLAVLVALLVTVYLSKKKTTL